MSRAITLVIGILLILISCFAMSSGSFAFVIMLIGVGFVFFGLMWTSTVEPIQKSNAESSTRDYISYDKETGTLKLNKRGVAIGRAVKITDAKDYTFKTEGPKLHVGSVSVGNVTTGGAYVTKGYNYLASSQKNGLCNLEYLDNIIYKIQLTDELYAEAKKSNISKYLNRSKQIEVVVSSYSEKDIEKALDSHSKSGFLGNDFLNNGKPGREKCNEILSWMIGS